MAVETFLPILSPGRHRSPRQGACFMEYASFLAGMRWSDHPACTHPTVAALARLVNDVTEDESRSQLAPLIPSVLGLNGSDERIPVTVAVLAASRALPIASEGRQRALGAALRRCERLLEGRTDSVSQTSLQRIRMAFRMVPSAEEWARAFEAMSTTAPRPISPSDEVILRAAVLGIAEACIEDADGMLRQLLADVIEEVRGILIPGVPAPVVEKFPALL